MTAAVLENGVYKFTLDDETTEQEFDLTNLIQTNHEFVIGQSAVFDNAVVKVQRWVSANTGWTDYISPQTESVVQFTQAGAGRALGFLPRTGKIKFVVVNPTSNTSIPIDILQ